MRDTWLHKWSLERGADGFQQISTDKDLHSTRIVLDNASSFNQEILQVLNVKSRSDKLWLQYIYRHQHEINTKLLTQRGKFTGIRRIALAETQRQGLLLTDLMQI
ncbi:hypothetical protein CBW22_19855 [Pantoea sp. VS1]|uniref:hypothetical protein n=1 Tax=Pantoea sp. VS1 TaxID=2003658 RepID=UPI000B50B2AF|nr:hypothetical protein [Pantoea sp. VS1]OWS74010.1 hypothetical protein CBW22_19855 [Pantoea sp. VS1]